MAHHSWRVIAHFRVASKVPEKQQKPDSNFRNVIISRRGVCLFTFDVICVNSEWWMSLRFEGFPNFRMSHTHIEISPGQPFACAESTGWNTRFWVLRLTPLPCILINTQHDVENGDNSLKARSPMLILRTEEIWWGSVTRHHKLWIKPPISQLSHPITTSSVTCRRNGNESAWVSEEEI